MRLLFELVIVFTGVFLAFLISNLNNQLRRNNCRTCIAGRRCYGIAAKVGGTIGYKIGALQNSIG